SVNLLHASVSFDDLAFDPDSHRVLAAPEGTGRVFVVDPDAMTVTSFPESKGLGSLDGRGGLLFLADRGAGEILVANETDGQVVASATLGAFPDYVRASPTSDEVWVSLPNDGRIDVYSLSRSPVGLTRLTGIDVGDPEGLTFDG